MCRYFDKKLHVIIQILLYITIPLIFITIFVIAPEYTRKCYSNAPNNINDGSILYNGWYDKHFEYFKVNIIDIIERNNNIKISNNSTYNYGSYKIKIGYFDLESGFRKKIKDLDINCLFSQKHCTLTYYPICTNKDNYCNFHHKFCVDDKCDERGIRCQSDVSICSDLKVGDKYYG